jgi:hypothetical protein
MLSSIILTITVMSGHWRGDFRDAWPTGSGRAVPAATGKYPAGHLVEGYVQTLSRQCDAACAKSLSVVSKARSYLMHSCASRASIVPS